MIKVTKEKFFDVIDPLDVIVKSVGEKYPYKSHFIMRCTNKLVGYIAFDVDTNDKEFFLEEQFTI